MHTDAELVAYYGRRAAEYERIYDKPERQSELARMHRLIEETFAGHTVLEIACGTGYWTQTAAKTAESIVAVDINSKTLELARQKPFARNNVEFIEADVYNLPAFQSQFSAALVMFWWSHMAKSRVGIFLNQLHKCLRPGAVVLIADNTFAAHSSTPVSFTDSEGNTFQDRTLSDGSKHRVLKNFPTEPELLSQLGNVCTPTVAFWEYYWVLQYSLPRSL